MRRWRTSGLPVLVGVLVCLHAGTQTDELRSHGAELAAARDSTASSTEGKQRTSEPRNGVARAVPAKAYDLLAQLRERGGDPLPGYVGGREFRNRERRRPRGQYREYDVNPTRRGRPRDAERLVIEQRTGKAYYTGDHYVTFIPLE